MRRIPPLLVECVLVGAIALGTAWTWMAATGTRVLTVGAVIVCTLVSVALAFAVEAVIKHARRGRPRRAHAAPPKTREKTS